MESVILFDIDGTLLSSAGAGKAALEQSMATQFGVEKIVDGLKLSGRTDRAILKDLFRMHDIPYSDEGFVRMQEGYLQHLPGCLRQVQGKVLPGIQLILEQLSNLSVCHVGLLTGNLRRGAQIKLGHFGIQHFFEFGGFGDHHLDRDDVAREAFAEVQHRVGNGLEKGKIWVVGDTPLDIQCARAIGAKVAAVATGWHTVMELEACAPDALFESLENTGEFLHKVLA